MSRIPRRDFIKVSSAMGAGLWFHGISISAGQADSAPSQTMANGIPVLSSLSDVDDDPENAWSGAPQFKWSFFGDQTRLLTKYPSNYPSHRQSLRIPYTFYTLADRSFDATPPRANTDAILDAPMIPVIQFAGIGKINRVEENGERAIAHDRTKIESFLKPHRNLIFGGGQVAEIDEGFARFFSDYYGRLPAGPGAKVFPSAYFDFIESNLKRSSVPYMMQEHNSGWGIHYVAQQRAMSMSANQLFYRSRASIVLNLVAGRSASRQYPHPFGVQFSGQLNLELKNAEAVVSNREPAHYIIPPFRLGPNYGKSYALNRQILYLSWLNGVRFFQWETGEFIKVSPTQKIPSPLGAFTAKAAGIISSFGPTGPVQTPMAILSEFANAWRPPEIQRNGGIDFKIVGDAPYAPGDYQMHGLVDLFYPHYLQSEMVYEKSMGEDFALVPTPFGNSVDFILSDARKEVLARYGLLVWGGVPPESLSVVRDKVLWHLNTNRGRVVLFGAVARQVFPEWFADRSPTTVARGSVITCGTRTISESADFSLETLREDLDAKALDLRVLGSVGGKPLIVECLGGLVLVLSDYGLNQTQHLSPDAARWQPNEMVKDLPHTLLQHATQLLADEAARQTLFTVDNKTLHYVVTRPRSGEYVLGLFNDKLNSEPFHITSHIGTIKSMEEVLLDDGKAELKTAAGGAAYAPAGLRNSPRLPLDYGLSDASHIEGRDVRLFRIRVQESGVKELPAIRCSNRPANRVVAVNGLEQIRRYLQAMPSFFEWFDGIKVDADAFLSLDDNWVVEQAHWLDRRGVRVVVDGTGIDGKKAAGVLSKLSLLKRAPKNLVLGSPTPELLASSGRAGVHVLVPSAVNRLSHAGHAFDAKADLNILDLHYHSEEDLYCDLRHFSMGKDVQALRGTRVTTGLGGALSAAADLRDDVCDAGPNLYCLKDVVAGHRTELAKIKQIKIDSTYLRSKTANALSDDAVALAGMNLKAVVDLRPDQMHFDHIAFYPHIPNYESGMKLFGQIVDKMTTLGANDLILRIADAGDMGNKEKYTRQRDETWNTFAVLAERQQIRLHLIFDRTLRFSSVANFSRPNVFVLVGSKGTTSPYVKQRP